MLQYYGVEPRNINSANMPSPNIIKEYVEDSYYHIYNRGVAKQKIFEDKDDYAVFLSLLKTAVISREERKQSLGVKANEAIARRFDLSDDVSINAFCLLPNHFHLLIHTKTGHGITLLMKSISSAYVQYFNKKYDRVGPLFQGRYKAVRIIHDSQAAHITRYIHLNALDARTELDKYPYSSYGAYTGDKVIEWVSEKPVLKLLNMNRKEYAKFVKSYITQKKDLKNIKRAIAEELSI